MKEGSHEASRIFHYNHISRVLACGVCSRVLCSGDRMRDMNEEGYVMKDLKIRVGRFYKRRDGKRVVVVLENEKGFTYALLNSALSFFVYKDGRYSHEALTVSNCDLVAPWPKKVKETGFKKPVYQWLYYDRYNRIWCVHPDLRSKEEAPAYFGNGGRSQKEYRTHAGPFEGSEP